MDDAKAVELVARALCEFDGYDPEQLEPGDDPYMNNTPVDDGRNRKGEICHFRWRRYDGKARAAIATLRPLIVAEETAALKAELAKVREALGEALLQLEYVDGRWPTGTTPAVLARISAILRPGGGNG